MSNLNNISTESLEAEIEKRKQADIFGTQFPHIASMHWDKVIEHADSHVQFMINHGDTMKDSSQWVLEAVLKAVYGEDVFDKLNNLYD